MILTQDNEQVAFHCKFSCGNIETQKGKPEKIGLVVQAAERPPSVLQAEAQKGGTPAGCFASSQECSS
jgi:hypothetical protein